MRCLRGLLMTSEQQAQHIVIRPLHTSLTIINTPAYCNYMCCPLVLSKRIWETPQFKCKVGSAVNQQGFVADFSECLWGCGRTHSFGRIMVFSSCFLDWKCHENCFPVCTYSALPVVNITHLLSRDVLERTGNHRQWAPNCFKNCDRGLSLSCGRSCGLVIEVRVSPRRYQTKPVHTNSQEKEKMFLTASITKDGAR